LKSLKSIQRRSSKKQDPNNITKLLTTTGPKNNLINLDIYQAMILKRERLISVLGALVKIFK